MILHHVDDGVHWDEALSWTNSPVAMQENLEFRKSKTDPSHKMYLKIS